ncbi:MAG: hypothetical protein V3V97_20135 [Hyphomicrobiaceae bacterium]
MRSKEKTGANIGADAEETLQCDKDWPAQCVDAALKVHAVPAGAARALTEALDGTAHERALKNSELTALAQKLIAATDVDPEPEAAP